MCIQARLMMSRDGVRLTAPVRQNPVNEHWDNSIMSSLLPLFPLELVAFPGAAIPLHIFEPRYREMVGEAETNGSEFGIVLSRDGGIVRVGCTVIVESILQRYADGRFDVLTRGRRRFEIQSLNDDRDYLRAEVSYFADIDSAPASAAQRASALRAWQELQREAADEIPGSAPDENDPQLSFLIAPALRDIDWQNGLLASRSEAERLDQIVQGVPKYLQKRQYVEKMRKAAPTNGKGHHSAPAGPATAG
jgi:Lon protease-like protein